MQTKEEYKRIEDLIKLDSKAFSHHQKIMKELARYCITPTKAEPKTRVQDRPDYYEPMFPLMPLCGYRSNK